MNQTADVDGGKMESFWKTGDENKHCRRGAGRNDGVDLLSDLPDDILIDVLSLLPLENAVQTSILSKRWKFLWMYVHNLEFEFSNDFRAIDSVLALHKGAKLQTLDIYHRTCCPDTGRVESWMHFAHARHVEKLVLNLFNIVDDFNEFPEILFKCDSVMHLELWNCSFTFPSSIHMPSLNCLCLCESEVSDSALLDFTFRCPMLRKVKLQNCNNESSLSIYLRNPNLVELEVEDNSCCDGHVEINGPYLTSLVISGSRLREKYILKNLSALKRAALDLEVTLEDDISDDDNVNLLVDIISCLTHVNRLQLSSLCLLILASFDPKSGRDLSIKSTCLELKTRLEKFEVLGLAYLLSWCSHVKSLKINLGSDEMASLYNSICFNGTAEVKEKCNLGGNEQHLDDLFEDSSEFSEEELWKYFEISCIMVHGPKMIQLKGFLNLNVVDGVRFEGFKVKRVLDIHRRQTQFVKILLANLVGLEEMTIACVNGSIREFSLLGRRLLSFPKASQKAQIVFL